MGNMGTTRSPSQPRGGIHTLLVVNRGFYGGENVSFCPKHRFRIMIMFLLGWGTAAFASRLCLLFLWIQASAHWEDGERLAAGLALADDDVNSRGR